MSQSVAQELMEPVDPVIADLTRQIKEEIGPEPVGKEEGSILRQKYGLSAPQLTPSEQNLIRREEQRNGRRR